MDPKIGRVTLTAGYALWQLSRKLSTDQKQTTWIQVHSKTYPMSKCGICLSRHDVGGCQEPLEYAGSGQCCSKVTRLPAK
jgi:hypothetical protein